MPQFQHVCRATYKGEGHKIHPLLHGKERVLAILGSQGRDAQVRARFLARVRDRLDGADALLVTAKDWVKARDLIDFGTWPVPVVVPVLELLVFAGAEPLVELLLATVASGRRDRAQPRTDRDTIANSS